MNDKKDKVQKDTSEQNSETKRNINYCENIGVLKVQKQLWLHPATMEFDRGTVRQTLRYIMEFEIECPCEISFRNSRLNDKIANSLVFYGYCAEKKLHSQNYRFLIKDLENTYTILIITSDKEFQLRHKESANRKYKQIRGEERKMVKEQLKAYSARDIYYQRIKERDQGKWNRGHPQKIANINTIHKVSSEAGKEKRLKCSETLQDFVQLCIEEGYKADPYLREVGIPTKAIMYTKEQLEIICENNILISHLDSTGSIIQRPCKSSRIDYYCLVCKVSKSVMPAAEYITCEKDMKSVGYFLKSYKCFVIKEHKNGQYLKRL